MFNQCRVLSLKTMMKDAHMIIQQPRMSVTEIQFEISIREFCRKIDGRSKCVEYLRQIGLLASNRRCRKCERNMKKKNEPERVTTDMERWVCSSCKTSLSIRDGSIFQVRKSFSNFLIDRI